MPQDCARFQEEVRISFSELNRYRHSPTREIARNIASNRRLNTVSVDEELTLENRRLIDEALYENESIETLEFFRVDPTVVDLRLCQRIKNLKEVDFKRTGVVDPTSQMFQFSRTLQKLSIFWGNVGDAAARAVQRSLRFRSCLTHIVFSDCGLSNAGIASIGRSLQQCSNIKFVHIFQVELMVEEEAAAELAQGVETNASIETFEFFVEQIHAAGWERIVRAVATNETLKKVYLSALSPSVEECFEAARLLKANQTLEQVFLDGHGSRLRFSREALATNHSRHTFRLQDMDTDMTSRFCDLLASNDTIEHLKLENGEFTVDVIAAIGHMLSNNTSLTSLAINKYGYAIRDDKAIDDDKAVALIETFKLSQFLDSLDLSRNRIGNRGAAAVADFVASNQVIKKIEFSDNNIGDDGFGALGRALEHNVSLEELTVSDVTDRGMRGILNGVKVHPAIKIVQVHGLSNTLHQDELNFYLERNKGPKRILHANLPLSIWPLVLKRADDCRQAGDRLRAPDLLYYFVTGKCELFTRTRGPSSRKRKRKRNNT